MTEGFQYDAFLSHSSKNKAVVRLLPQQLRKDGLKVWFDEWVLKPGDSIPTMIEEGSEHSRVLAYPAVASVRRRMLCMSANAFDSDWAQLEAGTFRFRDPLTRSAASLPSGATTPPSKAPWRNSFTSTGDRRHKQLR